MINKALFSSKSDQWATPQDFFDGLDQEFHFDLDPCADETNHKTPQYFTKEQDGLLQDWSGRRECANIVKRSGKRSGSSRRTTGFL